MEDGGRIEDGRRRREVVESERERMREGDFGVLIAAGGPGMIQRLR